MKTKRITLFITFYVSIILAILLTFFYIQDRYGHDSRLQKSEIGTMLSSSLPEKTPLRLPNT